MTSAQASDHCWRQPSKFDPHLSLYILSIQLKSVWMKCKTDLPCNPRTILPLTLSRFQTFLPSDGAKNDDKTNLSPRSLPLDNAKKFSLMLSFLTVILLKPV